MPAKCEKCGKPIRWLWNKETKKPAPIDFSPAPNGNIFIKDMRYRIATAEEIAKAKKIGKPLYLNHFVSCEFAETFSKKEQKKLNPNPECRECGLEMILVDEGAFWFCPFACSKIPVN